MLGKTMGKTIKPVDFPDDLVPDSSDKAKNRIIVEIC